MKRILFVQTGAGFRNPNKHILNQFRKHFPEHEIELYDVLKKARSMYLTLIINAFCVIFENFSDFVSGRKSIFKFRVHFLGTTYFFNVLTRLIHERLESEEYDFIFQTQTLCNPANDKGIPFFVYTDHTNLNNLNYPYIKSSEFLRTEKYVQLEREIFEKAAMTLVMSENIRESVIRQYKIPADKVAVVYVSTNTSDHPQVNESKYASKNILFVGKDWPRKGGPLLLDAFRMLKKRVPDARLTVIGCSPDIHEQGCVVKGEVSLSEVDAYYNNAAVFCMPTLREPFGIVFLEAMFHRLPVVTNNVGATPYIVEQGRSGYIINNDAAELAGVLTDLITNPEKCAALGQRGFDIASEKYTWDNMGRLVHDQIHKSLNQLKESAAAAL